MSCGVWQPVKKNPKNPKATDYQLEVKRFLNKRLGTETYQNRNKSGSMTLKWAGPGTRRELHPRSIIIMSRPPEFDPDKVFQEAGNLFPGCSFNMGNGHRFIIPLCRPEHSDHVPFLKAIWNAFPDNTQELLIYADWLEEHGDQAGADSQRARAGKFVFRCDQCESTEVFDTESGNMMWHLRTFGDNEKELLCPECVAKCEPPASLLETV